ncbi:MAG: methylphosphotriester-DNA--protein-cysteine methyltransferase family protein [Candidatus Heimdallarchaeota archaeon]|nr:MAG: methylphosphotriester-DNA--protein-cysteine methyltransferase family protein [Candidatus Heimdallarchaeota archaeon]
MKKVSYEEMVSARVRRDASYDGYFYVGVRTMKIFCLPSCKARLSLEKNMVFFSTREEAIVAGYRSCKRCKPDLFPNNVPNWLDKVLSYMKRNVSKRIDAKTLIRITGVEISTIRRHFKNHYQLTQMGFHRKLRLAYAKELLGKGMSSKELPSHCGFKSSSGFRTAFFKEFGHPPGETHLV